MPTRKQTKAPTAKGAAKVKARAVRAREGKLTSTPSRGPAATGAVADGDYRVRVRMYRQGLGDCFLLTFPRKGKNPFNLLIDCGALNRNKKFMTDIVERIEDAVKVNGKGRLDLVVATHEHKDHLSGFNQARDVFNRMEFGGVWLGWTENLNEDQAKAIKEAKKVALERLQAAVASSFANNRTIDSVRGLLDFSESDDTTGTGLIADALKYLKLRGKQAGTLKFLEPGDGPLTLEGVDDVRVWVLGPPRDPTLLKTSAVTQGMKGDSVIYHLGLTGAEGMYSLYNALFSADTDSLVRGDGFGDPFGAEHRIPLNSKWFSNIEQYIEATYDVPKADWRKIDEDWLDAFGQLALDLDNDTNNTSLVLAFEFATTGQILLFVGDAQVGNWQSWAKVSFKLPGSDKPLSAHDLVKRTVFYKVGHHCSHNATIKNGGLELMESDSLVAFIPLDQATAKMQGRKDASGQPKGWDMPAKPLYKRLIEKTAERVVISDVKEIVPPAAVKAGVTFDEDLKYVDYTLR